MNSCKSYEKSAVDPNGSIGGHFLIIAWCWYIALVSMWCTLRCQHRWRCDVTAKRLGFFQHGRWPFFHVVDILKIGSHKLQKFCADFAIRLANNFGNTSVSHFEILMWFKDVQNGIVYEGVILRAVYDGFQISRLTKECWLKVPFTTHWSHDCVLLKIWVWQSLHSHKGCEVPRWLQYWFKEKTAGTPYIILLLFTVMYIYMWLYM